MSAPAGQLEPHYGRPAMSVGLSSPAHALITPVFVQMLTCTIVNSLVRSAFKCSRFILLAGKGRGLGRCSSFYAFPYLFYLSHYLQWSTLSVGRQPTADTALT